MSAAAAAEATPAKGGKKKLIIILAAVLALAGVGGGGALMMMKKKAADAEAEGEEGEAKPAKAAKKDPKAAPAYVPLEMFTVNLADREAERYAQIGITLEMVDPTYAETLKAHMPAIRNNVLMVLAHKNSAELLEREGKLKLAEQIKRATATAIGYEVPEEESEEAEADAKAKPKKKRRAPPPLPVVAVHFSQFIVQ